MVSTYQQKMRGTTVMHTTNKPKIDNEFMILYDMITSITISNKLYQSIKNYKLYSSVVASFRFRNLIQMLTRKNI